jgi:glutamate-ammonia-ligase adenylyltransferase
MLCSKLVADTTTIDCSGIAFRNPNAAAQNLERVRGRVSASLFPVLLHLLAESPDPDLALNLFERLTTAAADEIFRQFERHQFLLHFTLTVFSYSAYLGETLIKNHDLFHALLREKNLDRSYSRDDFAEAFARFQARSMDTDISLLLARFKRREYVRIMLRDVLRIATLGETTAEISALSDVLIAEALRDTDQKLRNRYGPPQHLDKDGRLVDTPFCVLSLGKLGGNELNYSSDIDLLFLYGDGDEPPGASISLREYFIRLSQELTSVLSRATAEGAPFRIDLRLRPQGGEGEPAVPLSHALQYYSQRAADWELQALIKLRHSAGDQALAREFIRRVHPYVYTEQLNFAAIETALATREKIGQRRRFAVATRKAEGIDVKLDRGGIRDIEFLVQCLQRVYGGTELWLRSGGTLFSLQKLHDKEHISGKDFNELTTAYVFLRTIEHRLQCRHGQQTHRLPAAEAELAAIARAVRGPEARPGEFLKLVQKRMSAVAEIYERIIHHQQVHQRREGSDLRLRADGESREEAHGQLVSRLAVDSPPLYKLVQRPDVEGHTRRNLYRFLTAAATSADRYAIVTRASEAVERALPLFAFSDFLTDILVRHPEQIEVLANLEGKGGRDCRSENAPANSTTHSDFRSSGYEQLISDAIPYGEKLARLRRQYRASIFASGARDVLEARNVYDSLAETTCAADDAIAAALKIAAAPEGFAILALGRLGTGEHDLLSDADLLFVRDDGVDAVEALRAAERIVEVLSAYTRDGAVFPVDARLRPHGGEGELVVTPAQLEAYFAREAQSWEALTYTKLRYVTGAPAPADRAVSAVRMLTERFGSDPGFGGSLQEMRAKLEKTTDEFDDVKTGPGGIYDIDFIVAMLLVRHGLPGTGNLRQRLCALHDRGLLSDDDWKRLDRHAQLLRTVEHVIRLVVGKSRKTLPAAGPMRTACDVLCGRILKRNFPEGLDITVRFALVGVREIYRRLLE